MRLVRSWRKHLSNIDRKSIQNPSGGKSIGSLTHRVFLPQGCNWLCEVLGHGRTIPQAAFAVHWQVFLAASTGTKRANALNAEMKVRTPRHSKMRRKQTGTVGSALGSATAAPKRMTARKPQYKDYASCATSRLCSRRSDSNTKQSRCTEKIRMVIRQNTNTLCDCFKS